MKNRKYSSIQEAVLMQNTAAALEMIDSGAFNLAERDPDAGDITLLQRAIIDGDKAVFDVLMQRKDLLQALGVGINAIDNDGTCGNALSMAQEYKNAYMVAELLKHDAKSPKDVMAQYGEHCSYALNEAFEAAYPDTTLNNVNQYNGTVALYFFGDAEQAAMDVVQKRFPYATKPAPRPTCADRCLLIPLSRVAEMTAALQGGMSSEATLTQTFNTVVFTGTLSVKRAEAAAEAENAGFKVEDDIKGGVDLLVAGDKAGSKVGRAEAKGITVVNETQWRRILSQRMQP